MTNDARWGCVSTGLLRFSAKYNINFCIISDIKSFDLWKMHSLIVCPYVNYRQRALSQGYFTVKGNSLCSMVCHILLYVHKNVFIFYCSCYMKKFWIIRHCYTLRTGFKLTFSNKLMKKWLLCLWYSITWNYKL